MADENGKSTEVSDIALVEGATRVLENLAELEPQLIGAAILNHGLEVIAEIGGASRSRDAAELVTALLEASGDEEFDSAHVAGAEGEVFVVSEAGLCLVAVTGRFVLASLTSFDMRMALRDLSGSARPGTTVKANVQAGNEGSRDA